MISMPGGIKNLSDEKLQEDVIDIKRLIQEKQKGISVKRKEITKLESDIDYCRRILYTLRFEQKLRGCPELVS